MNDRLRKQLIIFLVAASFFVASSILKEAWAATLNLVPGSGAYLIGEEFPIDIKIDSIGQTINAAQAAVLFPKDKLEVTALKKDASVFTFWLEEPEFSNTTGKITFVGGIPSGVSGGSLQVLKIIFKGKNAGPAVVAFEDTAVTANDGSGTNLLTRVNGAALNLTPGTPILPTTSTATSTLQATTTPPLTPPPQIKRIPLPVKNLPVKPKVSAELYPDQSAWHNISSPFLIRWELPLDVSDIATTLNRDVNFVPPPISEGLTEGELVESLKDGIWYFHARFKNNVGWGETAHYKISIDTVPPAPFAVEILGGKVSDNPRPLITFKTSDALSGIDGYLVRTDNGEGIKTQENQYVLPRQRPGKHLVSVKALDRAQNGQETFLEIDVIPIPSPVVTFITPFITIGGGERFTARGTAGKSYIVHVDLSDRRNRIVAEGKTQANPNGEWVFTLEKDLTKGDYSVKVWAEDERGALSLPVYAGGVSVKEKPILTIGTIELTAGQVFFIIILFGVFGMMAAGYILATKKTRRFIRYGLVEYDFSKMVNLLEKDIEDLQKSFPPEILEEKGQKVFHVVGSLKETLKKIKTYLAKEIGKLKE